jgi:hypothetical protein
LFFFTGKQDNLLGDSPLVILVFPQKSGQGINGNKIKKFTLDEFFIKCRIIKIKCAVVENEISVIAAVKHPYGAVAKSGVQFLTGSAGEQADAEAAAVGLSMGEMKRK